MTTPEPQTPETAGARVARGYTDVSHVDGEFPAWKEAGLPATEPQPSAAP